VRQVLSGTIDSRTFKPRRAQPRHNSWASSVERGVNSSLGTDNMLPIILANTGIKRSEGCSATGREWGRRFSTKGVTHSLVWFDLLR